MNILYIRDFPSIDGTFTLLVRSAENASKDGHQPYFLFFQKNIDTELLNRITKVCPVIFLEDLPALSAEGKLPVIDIIHGILIGDGLLKAFDLIKEKYFPRAGIVIGNYHPRTFITKTHFWPAFDNHLYRRLFKKMPSRNLLFMNESVRKAHEEFFGLDFQGSALVPLMVDVPASFSRPDHINRNKIVSVGRLVYFKNYVSPLIMLISALNKRGYNFEFHIYGEGEMMDELNALIATQQASGFIYLHGRLNYQDFGSVLDDALLFVGMGTSVIESSSRGVPSVLAIESRHDDATYGWFFDQEGYEVGEQIAGRKTQSYEECILEAFNATSEEYTILCKKSWTRARDFSNEVVMQQYYRFLEQADRNFSFVLPRWQKALYKLLRQPLKWKAFVHRDYRSR